MARLFLKLDELHRKEVSLSRSAVSIGRLLDNDVQVDHAAVSGHHARIVNEGGGYALYDLNSTNGTYVNGCRVERIVLAHGDVIHIGRHVFSFEDEPFQAEQVPAPVSDPSSDPANIKSALDKRSVATLTILSGKTDHSEYVLGKTTVIGRSESANVRLLRWFAPKIATTIEERGGKYYIGESQSSSPVRVNSEVVFDERLLETGDTILVDDITMVFKLPR